MEQEDGGHRFIERGSIHVDGCAKRNHEVAGFFGAATRFHRFGQGDGHGGTGGVGGKCGHQGPANLHQVLEGVGATKDEQNHREHNQPMRQQSGQNGSDVEGQRPREVHQSDGAHRPRHQEEDANRGQHDDPPDDPHKRVEHRLEKVSSGLGIVPAHRQGNTQQQADHNDAERVAFAHFSKSAGGDQLVQNVFPRPTQRVFVAFVGRFDPGGRTRALVLGFGLSR